MIGIDPTAHNGPSKPSIPWTGLSFFPVGHEKRPGKRASGARETTVRSESQRTVRPIGHTNPSVALVALIPRRSAGLTHSARGQGLSLPMRPALMRRAHSIRFRPPAFAAQSASSARWKWAAASTEPSIKDLTTQRDRPRGTSAIWCLPSSRLPGRCGRRPAMLHPGCRSRIERYDRIRERPCGFAMPAPKSGTAARLQQLIHGDR